MKFLISRKVQSISNTEKPCEEAVKEELTPLDYRTVETLEEAKKKIWYKQWYEGGTNHREEDGMVVCERKEKEERWVVEINTLEELIKFQEKYGDIIIRNTTPYKETRKEIILP
ncbi:MAG: hypothetical protein GXO99_07705 [Nitrospirae bacterium]|nr:hypothetical protein [Nitrospirota bacterium]